MSGLLERTEYYFANEYAGNDEKVPKFESNIDDLREIVNLNITKCRMEKELNVAEVIRKLLCSEYGSSCSFCIQDNNPDAMCYNVGGSGSWCCKNAKWNGKSND